MVAGGDLDRRPEPAFSQVATASGRRPEATSSASARNCSGIRAVISTATGVSEPTTPTHPRFQPREIVGELPKLGRRLDESSLRRDLHPASFRVERPQSFAMKQTVLIVHGLGGSGPDHWQTWLAGRLRDRGPARLLPGPARPRRAPARRLARRARGELARLGPTGLVVACHSLGSVTWLHLASRIHRRRLPSASFWSRRRAQAPGCPRSRSSFPRLWIPQPSRGAAGSTRVVCADAGDPYRPEGAGALRAPRSPDRRGRGRRAPEYRRRLRALACRGVVVPRP